MYRFCRTGLDHIAEARAHRWGGSRNSNTRNLRRKEDTGSSVLVGDCPGFYPLAETGCGPAFLPNSIDLGFTGKKPVDAFTALKTAVLSYDIQRFLDSGNLAGRFLAVCLKPVKSNTERR
jgi:hypothetical protein